MLRRFIIWFGNWLLGTPADSVGAAVVPELAPLRAETPVRPQRSPDASAAPPDPRTAMTRIIAAFDSAHPVRQRKDLHGRDDKLEALFEAVLFNRQHAIIHGARGSGKTSLAQVFGDYADQRSAVVIYAACEASASFVDLLRPYFTFLPDSCVPFSEKANFERNREALSGAFGPREVVDFLSRLSAERQVIMIFDEFDRVQNSDVDQQIATLMKLLSDAQVPVQLLIVGIAHTLDDLINCHPSLRRHLMSIPIGRISQRDVIELIDSGAARARIAFDEAVKTQIVTLACGSPYHAQLFCYVAAIEATKAGSDTVDLAILRKGLERACEAWGMLNQDDHDRFLALATASAGDAARAELAAREAAGKDSLRPDAATAELLGDALVPGGGAGRSVFRDSTAPQFLLTMMALERARANAKADGTSDGSDPDDGNLPSLPLSIAV
jgi:hypothetical protein